jgi:hypothetical protein
VNHKRIEQLYHLESLALRRKRHRKRAAGVRVTLPPAHAAQRALGAGFLAGSVSR